MYVYILLTIMLFIFIGAPVIYICCDSHLTKQYGIKIKNHNKSILNNDTNLIYNI